MVLGPPKTVLIVGCGEFGVAAALSLVIPGGSYAEHTHLITMLDRAAEPPAIDAASSDLNKIVRQDYCDPFYASMAMKALRRWRTPEYAQNYHECGVFVAASKSHPQANYVNGSLAYNIKPEFLTEGKKAFAIENEEQVGSCYPKGVPCGRFDQDQAYFNEAGGWASSRQAVVDGVSRLRDLGVRFVHGEADSLIYKPSATSPMDVVGVKTIQGEQYDADLVILATGSWTSQLLPELATELLPTGQVIGTIQLTEEEGVLYRSAPVSLLLDTGFYCFPPNEENIIKFAIHGPGYLNPTEQLPSVPRTKLTPGFAALQIPASAKDELQAGLNRVYPGLADHKWEGSRICWYSDRPSGDWLLDYHPKFPSLFVASGGSGHAFKFFPVIGELIIAGINRTLQPEQKRLFSWAGDQTRVDGSRGGKIVRWGNLDDCEMLKL